MEKPYFDDVSPRNITTVVDDTAILKCRVKNKGDRTVSIFFITNNNNDYIESKKLFKIYFIEMSIKF